MTRICGIINVTPDSFSDGGLCLDPGKALEHAERLVREGADMLDVGGESSRPGSDPVCVEDELKRVRPVIKAIKKEINIPVSIDTSKPEVAEECLALGADMVNDISGLRDERMLDVVRRHGAGAIVMHMKGKPKAMQNNPAYSDVIKEIFDFFDERLKRARELGIENIILDPGIGFGKTTEHNLSIIKNLKSFTKLGRPVMVGPSRKSFIGNIIGGTPVQRLEGTLAACAVSAINGADIIRVHDVAECKKAIAIADAIKNAQ